ncbi:MAG: hypothetical protein AAB508_00050 [Patescibacteria group bacterium]
MPTKKPDQKATTIPTLVPQPSPTAVLDSAKKKTDGEKKLQEIFKELNLRGREYRVKTLKNGVIVIPNDGSNDAVLIKSILTAAQRDGQRTLIDFQPGVLTDFPVKHMPEDSDWLVIAVNDEPASNFVTGKEKVRDGSTVIYVEMYAAKLQQSHLGVDQTLLVTPNPQFPWEIYAELAASSLISGGTGNILLHPDFAIGQRVNMGTAVGYLSEIVKDYGGAAVSTFHVSPRDLMTTYRNHYASPSLNAYDETDDRDIFRLISFVKAPQ